MKSKTVFYSLIIASIIFTSCENESIRASKTTSTTSYVFEEYNTLELSGDFNAFVTFSDSEERIEIEASENLQDRIVVTREGNSLVIKLENNLNIKGRAVLNAYITTREIANFKISGDASVELDNALQTNTISIEATGDSQFMGELEANNLFIDLKGDSMTDVFGFANDVKASLSGNSLVQNYDLSVENLITRLSGDSEVFLSVSNTIDIDASGDSELNYEGNATIVRQRLSGDSRINKHN
ncbi:head GIN domain-containing protein [uncultured Croceitalea sp.]|uniref:head GIN domain-containing protein n=1 Tax=uncultured Croceitalea sp. TaxID=1798908 RepID=UPI0033066E7C